VKKKSCRAEYFQFNTRASYFFTLSLLELSSALWLILRMTISIIGAGKLGGALAIALNKKKFSIENLVARNFETAKKIAKLINPKPKILPADNLSEITSDVILIATQDSEIETVAAR
jgi:glutamyl-tRNA reductase